ncbi:MAG TPA: hypothetical protein VHO70_20255 [Chitinispirillaceae bacterium]|nr:hypothetical protein [Chitinispirillaceae bacterium]
MNRESTLQSALFRRENQKKAATTESTIGISNTIQIPISKIKDISANTATYSKARGRIEQGLIDNVFNATTDFTDLNCVQKWHGHNVFNTDGTYFQMQDSPVIPEKYRVQKSSDGKTQGYPQGLLQVLTQHGSGCIYRYCIKERDHSELVAIAELLNELPKSSTLLVDDLYNCHSFYCLSKDVGSDLIVPDKKNRSYRSIRTIAPVDEIVIDAPVK